MRGDRPNRAGRHPSGDQATPHARGSTGPALSSQKSLPGYPACAGIDLSMIESLSLSSWLPRMRGDRPMNRSGIVTLSKATPHARGSTCRIAQVDRLEPGYPACAGIDPRCARTSGGIGRLPRMRGDRPEIILPHCGNCQATPHARGSTLPARRPVSKAQGYPACAGIDRPTKCAGRWCARLPRMRGDRPLMTIGIDAACAATPHARGSTRNERGPRGLL